MLYKGFKKKHLIFFLKLRLNLCTMIMFRAIIQFCLAVPQGLVTIHVNKRYYQCTNTNKGTHFFLPPLTSSRVCFLNSF